jgi:hypothetical protein
MAITANPSVQNGALITGQGTKSFLNVTTATLVKATPGRIVKVNVLSTGTAGNGGVNDSATVVGAGSTNLVAVIPEAMGTYTFDFPCANGIVVTPPSGVAVSISYL